MVMYAGRLVEQGAVDECSTRRAIPIRGPSRLHAARRRPGRSGAGAIPGQPPNLQRLGGGCAFAPRCPLVEPRCRAAVPPLHPAGPDRAGACFKLEAV